MKALDLPVLIFFVAYLVCAQSINKNAIPETEDEKNILFYPQKNEIGLAVGAGLPLNYNFFNIPGDVSGGEFTSFSISYARYLFNSYSSIGICLDFCNATDVEIQSIKKITAEYLFGNLGMVYKCEFPEIIFDNMMPYLATGLYFSGNVVKIDENTELEADGGSVSFAVGLAWLAMNRSMQRNWVEFAVELKTFYGITKWETKPFEESSGLIINPFFIELNIMILFRF